jgi:hypothetical protein
MGIRAVQAGALTSAIDRALPDDHREMHDYTRAAAFRSREASNELDTQSQFRKYRVGFSLPPFSLPPSCARDEFLHIMNALSGWVWSGPCALAIASGDYGDQILSRLGIDERGPNLRSRVISPSVKMDCKENEMRSIITPIAAVIITFLAPTLLVYPPMSDAAQLGTDGAKFEVAETSDNVSGNTGIEGQVIIRPVRPHETPATANFAPYRATVLVLSPSGKRVTTFHSDPGGNFHVALPPGTYVLQPQWQGPYPRASEQTVLVSRTGFTRVRIIYGSGIR